jgi:beta-lactamase class A
MRIRRAPAILVLSGSIALVGAVFALADAGHPRSAPSTTTAAAASGSAGAAGAVEVPQVTATAVPTTVVTGLIAADGGHASVAVENLGTGATASYNVSNDYVTASIVKLDILCTLLYRDERSGHAPSDAQKSLITSMIENSDNDAAQHLYEDVGGGPAITAANRAFGLTDTAVEANTVDEAGYSWGDTTTTALDQVRLLRQVFAAGSLLTSADRAYIQTLMAHVESDQRWGVSAAADDPSPSASDYLLKNGWLPRKTTTDWEINSIGEVQHDGQKYLVAVLSNDNKTEDSGIDLVQQLAKDAVDASD